MTRCMRFFENGETKQSKDALPRTNPWPSDLVLPFPLLGIPQKNKNKSGSSCKAKVGCDVDSLREGNEVRLLRVRYFFLSNVGFAPPLLQTDASSPFRNLSFTKYYKHSTNVAIYTCKRRKSPGQVSPADKGNDAGVDEELNQENSSTISRKPSQLYLRLSLYICLFYYS